ncbi:MAG: hypothetical protein HXY21_01275 [Parvularculaceae bacterium]|nr:hypothetical protein [Parvularculaceae bacterium]
MRSKPLFLSAVFALAAPAALAQTDSATCDPGTINENGHFTCDFDMAMG